MELQELSVSLLESLVAVVAALGELVATTVRSDGDVELAVSPRSLWKRLEPFKDKVRATLGRENGSELGDTLATPGATWASVSSAASAWQDSVATAVGEWIELTREAIELLEACRVTATKEGGTVATGDLQDKVATWLNCVGDLVAQSRRLPVATDEEKGRAALEDYKVRVGAAKEKTLVALRAMEEAVVATSEAKAATKRGQRAEVALGLLEDLVAACAKATEMFRELSCAVGDAVAALLGTREAFPDVPEGLVATVATAERLWEASSALFGCHLNAIMGAFLRCDRGTVAQRCQKAKESVPGMLQGR